MFRTLRMLVVICAVIVAAVKLIENRHADRHQPAPPGAVPVPSARSEDLEASPTSVADPVEEKPTTTQPQAISESQAERDAREALSRLTAMLNEVTPSHTSPAAIPSSDTTPLFGEDADVELVREVRTMLGRFISQAETASKDHDKRELALR